MTLPVYVCSIAKNEAKHVRKWAESAKDADAIYMLDTGSTDDTVAIARECGVIVFEKTYKNWSFAAARNDLREMLPDHDAWLVNMDLDEVFKDGWRDHWKDIPDSANRLRYRYIWNWKADGVPGVEYHGDKLVRRHSHKWVNKVHEVNVTQEGYIETQHFLPNFEIHHHADNTKSRSNYLPLLLEDVAENPNNDRNMYYCARELFFSGRFEESVTMFKRHLVMPESVWGPERAWSMRYLAKMIPDEAEHWHLRACSEYKEGAETWTDLARFYHGKEDWFNMYYAAKRALTCQLYKGLYLSEPDAYGWWPNDMAALSAHNLGLHEQAIHHGQIAVDLNGSDQRLVDNLFFYRNAVSKVDIIIPTKSNLDGLNKLIAQLSIDNKVNKIIVVTDGTQDLTSFYPEKVRLVAVNRGAGIHKMWNLGLSLVDAGSHVAFINDDVSVNLDAMTVLCAELDKDARIGLICPKYAGDSNVDIITQTTCRGRYNGTGGMAGFCMMLASNLVPHFRFDERMVWWYGDDDLVNWVNHKANRLCVISGQTRCIHGHSVTITNDPPDNFNEIVINDKKVYEEKWHA